MVITMDFTLFPTARAFLRFFSGMYISNFVMTHTVPWDFCKTENIPSRKP